MYFICWDYYLTMCLDACITRACAHAHLKTWCQKTATSATSGTFRCNDARKCCSSDSWPCSSFCYTCCLAWYFKGNRVVACSSSWSNICYKDFFGCVSVIGTTVLSEVIFRYVAGITIGLVVFMCVEVAHECLAHVWCLWQVDPSSSLNVVRTWDDVGPHMRERTGAGGTAPVRVLFGA